MTNYAMDAENRLTLLFVGQGELRRRLSMAVHEALNQRAALLLDRLGELRQMLAWYCATIVFGHLAMDEKPRT